MFSINSPEDWIVVIRKVKDSTTLGEVVKGGLPSRVYAESVAAQYKQLKGYNVWVMQWKDY